MIYTDNPASDYDTYMNEGIKICKQWHEENDPRLQQEIEEIESKIEDLKIDLKNATDEDKKWDIECNIEELQNDIKKIRKEMEEEY